MATDADAGHLQTEVFWKIHTGLPQQGPGSDDSTRRALAVAGPLPARPSILDLGCGPGRQTLVLAEETGGTVCAVDVLPPFLAQVEERASAAGLSHRITTRTASMAELDDPDESYDLLWSEGAIYNIGFSEGLRGWHRLLRPGGTLAVTEVCWLVDSPRKDIFDFWAGHYPGIRDRGVGERLVEECGYRLRESFLLSDHEWWDGYYTLIEARVKALRGERDDAPWHTVLDIFDEELRVVRDGLDCFGYVFFVMEKV